MKSIILSLCLVLTCVDGVMAQSATPQEILDRIYNQLNERQEVTLDSVKYTGDDFRKTEGFAWQRGKGKGWTTGCRLTLTSVSQKDVDKIHKDFETISNLQYVNLRSQSGATYIEDTHTAYLYSYDVKSGNLYFLKARTEGEICIPANWTHVDFVDATTHDPFEMASETDLRLFGLSRLWSGVKRNFVFMDRVHVNWDSLYVASIPAIMQAKDRDECFLIMQRMAAQLNDGHTYIYGADPRSFSAPFSTVLIGKRIYVDNVESSVLSKQGLRRGMELVSINGESAWDYGELNVRPYVSSSTPQWTLHQIYESYGLLSGKAQDKFELTFASDKDTLFITYIWGSAKRDLSAKQPTLSFKKLDKGIGYLRISSFMDSNFKQKFDQLYPQILKSSALIIDVRNNNGGNSGYADYILRHLSKDSIRTDKWRSPMYIPAYASWSRRQPWYESPSGYMSPINGAEAYLRPVVVLVNRGTFSSAEDFCSVFIGMKRGKLIGSPTGGSTGNGVRVELIPGHSYANICSKHDAMPDGTEFVGIGIKPDIEVSESYESYFEDKNDACMKIAIDYLQSL